MKKQLGISPAFRHFLMQRSQVRCLQLGALGYRGHSRSVQVQKRVSLMELSASLARPQPA